MKVKHYIFLIFTYLSKTSSGKNGKTPLVFNKFIKQIGQESIYGFDCSRPTAISKHTYSEPNICDVNKNPKTEMLSNKHFQVLQKNYKVQTQGKKCQIFKTTNSQYCGVFGHSLSLDPLDKTHVNLKVPVETCVKWHRSLTVKPRDLGFDSFLDPTTPEKS